MTTVLAGGDSFVWGSELADSPHGGPNGILRIPFLRCFLTNYICAAYPGAGNFEINRNVRSYLNWMKNDVFVIVSWTWPSRDGHLHSDDSILSLQQYLEFNKFRYMFTCADNCVVTHNPKINWDNWFFFPPGDPPHQTSTPRGFYQWARENKYKCGPENHPLEEAHRDAAKLMQDKFYELVKKPIQQD